MRATLFLTTIIAPSVAAFVPLIDGGKEMPKLYDGWFNEQIAKQANAAIGRALGAGKVCGAMALRFGSSQRDTLSP